LLPIAFAVPGALALLSVLPLLVWLHRLRVKRERRDTAGTFLWQQARAQGARRPRFRASLLLALQLLAATALALAAARPYLPGDTVPTRILVIDTFASLAAEDGAGSAAADTWALTNLPADATRLEVAKRIANQLAEDGGEVAILQAGGEPTLLLAATRDRLAITQALASLTARETTRDPQRALALARSLQRALTPANAEASDSGPEIHWLSDVPPPGRTGVTVHPLAGSGQNVGITGFERIGDQLWLRLSSNQARPTEATIEFRQADRVVGRSNLLIPARGSVTTTLPAPGGAQFVEARILDNQDALSLDDVAWVGDARIVVALEEPFDALERALAAIDDVQVRVTPAAANLTADVYVLEDRPSRTLPEGMVVLWPNVETPAVAATVRSVNASDPLMRYVPLNGLTVAYVDASTVGDPAGVTLLAATVGGVTQPLLTRVTTPERTVLTLAFHPARGEWTRRPTFPTWVVNLIDQVRTATRVPLGTSFSSLASFADERFGGERFGEESVTRALEPGIYRLTDRTVHASLLDDAVTQLPPPFDVTDAKTNGGATDSSLTSLLPRGWTTPLPGTEWTMHLLVLAAVLLLAEALLYRAARRAGRAV